MSDNPEQEPKRRHNLADHQFGRDPEHTHDGEDADHDHDVFYAVKGRPEDDPTWQQDNLSMLSVGIDIGSSGTQLVFSRLKLQRQHENPASRYAVVGRETVFQSAVSLTPYRSETRIDENRLRAIVDQAYRSAGIHPDEVDTGAVILTGEALRRENARAITDLLAAQGGEFVCATAGHHMEATLAACGSGAARVSARSGKRILNIDIGGGTTKLAVAEGGKVRATAALHVGGRLLVVDFTQKIVRLDPAGRHLAGEAGFDWQLGDQPTMEAMKVVAEWMADAVISAAGTSPLPQAVEDLYLTDPLPDLGPIDGVMFSGGVAEYVYGREKRDFYDMGRLLGAALKKRVAEGALPYPLLPAGECMRATAIGASQYSIQLSGNTSYISDPASLLPRTNLQVLQPAYDFSSTIDSAQLARAIRSHLKGFDLNEGETPVALAFDWSGAPSHQRVSAFAAGIVQALPNTLARKLPLYLVLNGDLALTLGALLREEMGVASDILVIDGISLLDFDYIDLGRIRFPSRTVPVTVKSLVFSQDARAPEGHAHSHDGLGAHTHEHGHSDHHHDHHH